MIEIEEIEGEITLLEMVLDPERKKYDLFFKTVDVLQKISLIYHMGGAKIVAFHRRLENLREVTMRDRRSTREAINEYKRRKSLNFLMLWDAAQFEKGCDHYKDGIPDDIAQCKCYKFLYELLSDNDITVRTKGHKVYRLKVKA